VSRTQYQFSLEDANPAELVVWAPRLVDKLNSMPQFSGVSTDISAYGLTTYIDIDRDTAGRFGITPATIDNALYDSFGQRIVSTIFTNSNQYRVILETDPKLQASLDSLSSLYVPTSTSNSSVPGQVPLSVVARVREGESIISASFRRPRSRSISGRAGRSAKRSMRSSRRARRSACRSAPTSDCRARRWRSRNRFPTSCC
jgi:multidrug efflux pump subunit AcrB